MTTITIYFCMVETNLKNQTYCIWFKLNYIYIFNCKRITVPSRSLYFHHFYSLKKMYLKIFVTSFNLKLQKLDLGESRLSMIMASVFGRMDTVNLVNKYLQQSHERKNNSNIKYPPLSTIIPAYMVMTANPKFCMACALKNKVNKK